MWTLSGSRSVNKDGKQTEQKDMVEGLRNGHMTVFPSGGEGWKSALAIIVWALGIWLELRLSLARLLRPLKIRWLLQGS